jgi:hypothetical protein
VRTPCGLAVGLLREDTWYNQVTNDQPDELVAVVEVDNTGAFVPIVPEVGMLGSERLSMMDDFVRPSSVGIGHGMITPSREPVSSRKRIAVVQSNYIPWKGFFDLIAAVDEFILYDDVQYTRRDWRNRNQIKTVHGLKWLTVPLNIKGRYTAPIKDMIVADRSWAARHWKMIVHNYGRASCFDEVADWLKSLYTEAEGLSRLSEVNYLFIEAICRALGFRTRLSWSMDYELIPGKTERLVGLCQQAGATEYLSGPSARAYMDEDRFRAAGISVLYADYAGYPEYRQLHPPFVHTVSVIDLLLNEGSQAHRYLKRSAVAGRGTGD